MPEAADVVRRHGDVFEMRIRVPTDEHGSPVVARPAPIEPLNGCRPLRTVGRTVIDQTDGYSPTRVVTHDYTRVWVAGGPVSYT